MNNNHETISEMCSIWARNRATKLAMKNRESWKNFPCPSEASSKRTTRATKSVIMFPNIRATMCALRSLCTIFDRKRLTSLVVVFRLDSWGMRFASRTCHRFERIHLNSSYQIRRLKCSLSLWWEFLWHFWISDLIFKYGLK